MDLKSSNKRVEKPNRQHIELRYRLWFQFCTLDPLMECYSRSARSRIKSLILGSRPFFWFQFSGFFLRSVKSEAFSDLWLGRKCRVARIIRAIKMTGDMFQLRRNWTDIRNVLSLSCLSIREEMTMPRYSAIRIPDRAPFPVFRGNISFLLFRRWDARRW